ncbi:phosphate-starvation-inducible PsiE family protein [Ignisphaera sp. 4213-co]|uniref:Phosphate-starvation-inducible PsiE family protein n=1 Tax=Ignisphaera cupida TaxID=3050454 RepID=A0ABD4Z8P5_9CREN|nr:phosphate-starvation-inducible PsiE family protein [Ignisphaera sp. 4213-co]MDK6028645.1 phosphate-starvation-inducible PsiE family protein [Ignisphaera sp. 4213-co]
MSWTRRLRSLIPRFSKLFMEISESLIIVILAVLCGVAFSILIKDLISINIYSPVTELQLVFTELFTIIILIELLRTFVRVFESAKHSVEEFLEVGIIILVREVALGALMKEPTHMLMASGGALLLALAILVMRRKSS